MIPEVPSALVMADATVHFGSESSSGLATFSWRADDPAVVKMTMFGVEWVLSRAVLAASVEAPDGESVPQGAGDVTVYRDNALTVICLDSPEGRADVIVAESDLADLLSTAAAYCPPDCLDEALLIGRQVDNALERIFLEDAR